MFLGVSVVMELYYVLVQNAPPPPRHVLCERVAAAASGFWLYRYVPRYDVFFDDGYAKDLGQLKQMITERHGWFEEAFLVRRFEEVANLFALRKYPRVIYLTPQETFCTRISGELFYAVTTPKDGVIDYVKKWPLDGEKPRSLQEAMERLSEYAQRVDAWVIFKHYINHTVAYLAYPSP